METKPKKKVRYDLWFLIILVILLWTLAQQLFSFTGLFPEQIANINLWFKIIANCIAIFGVVWVMKMYLINTKKQARRKERMEQAIKKHPELNDIIKDIMGR